MLPNLKWNDAHVHHVGVHRKAVKPLAKELASLKIS